LAALSLIADKPQQERMIMLSTAGFQPKEIADICGTTSNTVRVSLSTMRKKGKGKQSKTKVSKKLTNSLDIE
jgi:DNA-directed RNA polymerase specialized sigma24 family protein